MVGGFERIRGGEVRRTCVLENFEGVERERVSQKQGTEK